MSLSVLSQPATFIQSANNPAYYVVSSSNATNTDFKYRADLYISGSKVTTLKSFPDPTLKSSYFDLSGIIPSFVSYDFFPTSSNSSSFMTCSNSGINVQLQFGEEYIAPNTNFSQSLNLASSVPYYFINAALGFKDNQRINWDDYGFNSSSNQKKFLQNKSDNTLKAFPGLKQWLYFYQDANSIKNALITTYDQFGHTLGNYTIPFPYSASAGVFAIQTGMDYLKNLPTSSFSASSGITGSIINDSVSSYIVSLVSSSIFTDYFVNFDLSLFTNSDNSLFETGYSTIAIGTNASVPILYKINCNCGRFRETSVNVYWLNCYGGFDSAIFSKKNIQSITKQQSSYKKVSGKLNSAGNVITNNHDQATLPFYTSITNKLELNSDFLSDSEILYLKDLVTSPIIYIEDETGFIQAATISDNDYKISKRVNTKTYSLKVNLELSQQDYRQLL